jgi:antitoxin component YwqK of YwqJK toxin-antitoxin module
VESFYDNDDGTIYIKTPYIDDERHGIEEWFYENGNI